MTKYEHAACVATAVLTTLIAWIIAIAGLPAWMSAIAITTLAVRLVMARKKMTEGGESQ